MNPADLFTHAVNLSGYAVAIAWPPLWGFIYSRTGLAYTPRKRRAIAWAIAGFCSAIGALMAEHWLQAAIAAVNFAIGLWLWWRDRRKDRRRAASLIGAKTLALRDALVRKQREAKKPRPVLRPQPGGAW